jgi:hypothetical protein
VAIAALDVNVRGSFPSLLKKKKRIPPHAGRSARAGSEEVLIRLLEIAVGDG